MLPSTVELRHQTYFASSRVHLTEQPEGQARIQVTGHVLCSLTLGCDLTSKTTTSGHPQAVRSEGRDANPDLSQHPLCSDGDEPRDDTFSGMRKQVSELVSLSRAMIPFDSANINRTRYEGWYRAVNIVVGISEKNILKSYCNVQNVLRKFMFKSFCGNCHLELCNFWFYNIFEGEILVVTRDQHFYFKYHPNYALTF